MFRSNTHNLCSTYVCINVYFKICINATVWNNCYDLNTSHNMQHVAECPTWEHSHPNRCWVSKWEHGYLIRCSVSKMGTWLSESMFGVFSTMEHGFPNRCWISHMGTWFAKSMLNFQSGNMGFQSDVGCKFTHWVQTMGSNNGFKHDAMHKSRIILICWMMHSLSAPPPAFPPVHPFLFPVSCPVQPLGNIIAGLLHNTTVEHMSYLFYIWWCRH